MKKRLVTMLVCILVVTVMFGTSVFAAEKTNLLIDGGFEKFSDAAPSAEVNTLMETQKWAFWTNAPDDVTFSFDNEVKRSGDTSVKIHQTKGAGVYATVTASIPNMEKGKKYTLRAFVKVDAPEGGATMSFAAKKNVGVGEIVGTEFRSPADQWVGGTTEDWKEVKWTVYNTNSDFDCGQIWLTFNEAVGDVWFDDVAVVEGDLEAADTIIETAAVSKDTNASENAAPAADNSTTTDTAANDAGAAAGANPKTGDVSLMVPALSVLASGFVIFRNRRKIF